MDNKPLSGDIVCVNRGLYKHYGIYINNRAAGLALAAVFAFAMLVFQACEFPHYNPSFANKPKKDNSARAPAENGYGTFFWNITFPENIPIEERSFFRLKYMPESPNELELGLDDPDEWKETWLNSASGSAHGNKEIPAGLYFLELYLGAEYSYAAKFDLFRVQRDVDNPFNVTFSEEDFTPYTLVNINLTLASDVPVAFSAARNARVTLYNDEYCTQQVESINAGQPEIALTVTALGATARASEWMALPDADPVDNEFSSNFWAKLEVMDANGRIFTRKTPCAIPGQIGAIYLNPTPLLRRIAVTNDPPNGGTVSFSQDGAIAGAGYDPEGGDVTVTVRGAGGYGLETINISDGTLHIIAEDTFSFNDMPTENVNVTANWVRLSGYVCELLPGAGTTSNYIDYRHYTAISSAVGNATTGTVDSPNVIRILQNIDLDSAKIGAIAGAFTSGKHIKLTVPSGATKTLTRTENNSGAFFTVGANSSLTLEGSGTGNIILDGGAVWTGGAPSEPYTGITANDALVQVAGGAFVLKDGAVLRNNCNTSETSGGGVLVNTGSFTMNGGTISGNWANIPDGTHRGGGGVMASEGVFTINSGTIRNNRGSGYVSGTGGGGGVYVARDCSFTMKGGTISGNRGTGTLGDGRGGGIATSNDVTVNIEDGFITGNEAPEGGGVYLYNFCTLNMSGGTISNNTAGSGGGVNFYGNGYFNMSSEGKIYNNTASVSGGGVYVSNGMEFRMTGGTIRGNSASGTGSINGGGGVYVYYNASFLMSGGTIGGIAQSDESNNAVNGNGGGVFVANGSSFDMSGGTIRGNGANNAVNGNGGGVFVAVGAVFTMSDGTIGGSGAVNSAVRGGGVFVTGNGTVFNVNSPASQTSVSGNNAVSGNHDVVVAANGAVIGGNAGVPSSGW